MQQARKTDFALFFKLLKGHRPFGIIGLIFTCLSLFVLLPLILTITSTVSEPYQSYDTETIRNKGTQQEAVVTNVREIGNVSVNGSSPKELSYTYKTGGKTLNDKFQTLDLSLVDTIPVGSTVQIKTYNNESVILGLEPFIMPVQIFYGIPGIFLLVGSIFLLIGLLPALKNYKLYKYGVVKDAVIASMAPYTYSMSTRHNIKQGVKIDYYFTGRNGQKIFGKSVIDDYSVLHEKKSGDTIKIFTDPKDELKSTVVPRLENLKYDWHIQV